MSKMTPEVHQQLCDERESLLAQFHERLEVPMLVLSFVWLGRFVVEIVRGLSPLLEDAGYAIWGLFLLEFALGFTIAPHKLVYLRHNWLKAIALVAPALRLFRIVAIARLIRAARVARGLRMLRLVSSLNRGMNALGASLVGRDAASDQSEIAGQKSIDALREEVARLRADIRGLGRAKDTAGAD